MILDCGGETGISGGQNLEDQGWPWKARLFEFDFGLMILLDRADMATELGIAGSLDGREVGMPPVQLCA